MSEVLSNPGVVRVRAALDTAGVTSAIVELPGAARTAVERSLSGHAEIWAAAGHPHTVFRLTYEELVRITGGRPVEVAA